MLEAFGLSDPGCVRPNNEDYFISDSESGILVLADGMGGANAGECASHLGAERLYEALLQLQASDGALCGRHFRRRTRQFARLRTTSPNWMAWGPLCWWRASSRIQTSKLAAWETAVPIWFQAAAFARNGRPDVGGRNRLSAWVDR